MRAHGASRDGPIMDSNCSRIARSTSDTPHNTELGLKQRSNTSPILLNVPEALTQLKVSRGLLYRFMRTGQVKFVKLGNRTLFRPVDLETFVNHVEAKILHRDRDGV
jgi:hypothetical protein